MSNRNAPLFVVLMSLTVAACADSPTEPRLMHLSAAASSRIVFARMTGTQPADIFVMNADGSGLVQVTNDTSLDASPRWMPGSNRIAYIGGPRNGVRKDIYLIDAEGNNRRQMTSDTVQNDEFAWLPTGDSLVESFRLNFYNDSTSIAIVDTLGNYVRTVATGRGLFGPTVSPDGKHFLFEGSTHYDPFIGVDLYVVAPDGSALNQITKPYRVVSNTNGRWAPTGLPRIAFVKYSPDLGVALCVKNAFGGPPTILYSGPGGVSTPAWSPDGTKIAFVSAMNGNSDIYVINADGSGGLTQITFTPESEYGLDWGP